MKADDEKAKDIFNRCEAAIIESFLAAHPPADLRADIPPGSIKPDEHVITVRKFEEILAKHGVTIGSNIPLFLNSGPKLVSSILCRICGEEIEQATEIRMKGRVTAVDPTWVHSAGGAVHSRTPLYHAAYPKKFHDAAQPTPYRRK